MFVLNVIPFSKSAPAGTLSYRSRTAVEPGTLVRTTLRRKPIHALVVECVSVAEAKTMLKTASFTLTGSKPAEEGSLPAALVTAAARLSEYHAATLGTTYASLFAPFVQEEFSLPKLDGFVDGSGYAEEAVEGPLAKRSAAYRTRIEEMQKRGVGALLIAPTIAELSYWERELADLSPVVLSGAIPSKLRSKALSAASKPGALVLSTPAFGWTPLAHVGLMILERVSAGSYRMAQRPYLDMRIAARELAKSRSLPLLIGDYPLPLEYRPVPDAPLAGATRDTRLIDVRRPKEELVAGGAWKAVPDALRDEIAETLAADGRVLVLAVRKGYAPAVVCRDCGHTLTDERGAVLTFSMRGGERILRTADGVTERPADTLCPSCASWNLLPLGIGIERVAEELRLAFPDARIVEASREVRTKTAAKKLLEDAGQPGTIVLGTESVLPWLLGLGIPAFDLGALASADSLLAVPFWRARERLVRLGLLLSQCADRTVVVSRLPEDTAVQAITAGTEEAFFKEETQLRKAVGYPPFGTLLVVQAEAPRGKIESLDSLVRRIIGAAPYTVLPDRAVSATVLRRSYVLRIVAWPDAALSERLQHLPPSVRILVDPEAF